MPMVNGLEVNIDDFNRRRNNCYTYAINQPINPHTKEPYIMYDHCQPGNLGGRTTNFFEIIRDCHYSHMIKAVRADLRAIGYDIVRTTWAKRVPNDNCWKVALAVEPPDIDHDNPDYHWFRLNKDGSWSHKLGPYEIKTQDFSRDIIKDPRTCDRGRYEIFMGFYMIKRKVS